MNKLTGIVEAVGTKFSGSLKVNGDWLNFKKGVKNPGVKAGDQVALTLGVWNFDGKTGTNITEVDVLAVAEAPAFPPISGEKGQIEAVVAKEAGKIADTYKARDFDAEARGKCRHGLTVALAPLIATDTITLEKAKELANALVEFSMTGK